ncbi:MAG: hypothetical protein DDT33_00786 [Firmicutes bacterium]|nr:hypothetical protein [Bacillota bacterium]
MKKDTFYKCMIDAKQNISAVKTAGYSEGDIGVHKEGKVWQATHIPTGLSLCQGFPEDTTRKAVLERAQKLVVERIDFAQKVKDHLGSAAYDAFLRSKHCGRTDEA